MKAKPQTTKQQTTTRTQATRAQATRGQATTTKATATKAAPGLLQVTGEGEIKVRPDLALVDLDVVTNAKSAQQAVAQNAERMTRVIDSLKEMGIRGADIQTVGYDVIPLVDREEKSPTFGQILEYRVISQLRVRASVEEAGEVIDMGVRAGANLVSGIRYGLREESTMRARALGAAVAAARRDAETVADSMAIKLKNPARVEISLGGSSIFYRDVVMARNTLTTPIEPGNIEIRATVQVVYSFAP